MGHKRPGPSFETPRKRGAAQDDGLESALASCGLNDGSCPGPGLNIAYRPSRRVPYMQNIDGIVPRSVENPVWVANNGNDTDSGALRNARGSIGRTANAVNDIF
jgi:hypothetical protein